MSTSAVYLQPAIATPTLLAVPFSYISSAHVQVIPRTQAQREAGAAFDPLDAFVEGVDYTFPSAGQVSLTVDTDGVTDYEVRRVTPTEALATQQPGVLSSEKVNLVDRQALYRTEEAADRLDALASRALLAPYGEDALPLASFASAEGKVLAILNGKVTPQTNTIAAAESAALRAEEALADTLPLASQVEADAEQVAADRVSVTAAKEAALAALGGLGNVFYETTLAAAKTAGLAAVADGVEFYATGDDVTYVGLYRDDAGVATEIARIATLATFDAVKQVWAFGTYNVVAGAWYFLPGLPVNTAFDTVRFFLTGTGTADIYIHADDVNVLGPFAVTTTPASAAVSLTLLLGQRPSFQIANITGAPTALLGQIEGLAA